MAVENTTNIAGLDDTLPTGNDTKSEGDNHLRLLKTVLKHAFAGFPGEVLLAATEAQGGTTNDFVLTVAPAPTAYANNLIVAFRSTHANTGAATLKIGALAPKALLNAEGTPLRPNAIAGNTGVLAVYDGTSFRIMGGGNSQAVYDYVDQTAFQTALPSQPGNGWKFLRTSGDVAFWDRAIAVESVAPTGDIGPIFIPPYGLMKWFNGNYAPNNLPRRYRDYPDIITFGGNVTGVTRSASWRSAANECDIVLEGAMNKRLLGAGAGFVVGDAQDGLFSGTLTPNTFYHFFAIRRDSDGLVDLGFSTNYTALDRPAGWTAYRRIASVLWTGTEIRPFKNSRDKFQFYTPMPVLENGGAVTSAAAGLALPVPALPGGVEVDLSVYLQADAAFPFRSARVYWPDATFSTSGRNATVVAGPTFPGVSRVNVPTNDGGQVFVLAIQNDISAGLFVTQNGFRDFFAD